MTITFLGTGTSQGVPVIGCDCDVCRSLDFRDKRLRSSIHISDKDVSVVIDTGPDFRQQMLRERIHKLDAICYTHEHKDHTAGMDDIRSYNFRQKKDMPIYGRDRVLEQIKREFAYVFQENKYPGTPSVQPISILNDPFAIGHLNFIPIEVMHYKLSVHGFRIGDFTYITDANFIEDAEKEKIIGSKVLVLNALRKDPHISHFSLDEAVELAKELNVEKTYLTHISHLMGAHASVSKELPDNVELAWDGLKINL